MSNDNEKKHIKALNALESEKTHEEEIEFIFNSSSLDLIEKIMSKMEWNLSTTINSCMTHTISNCGNSSFSDFDKYSLNDDSEKVTDIDLSIKNEARLKEAIQKNSLEMNAESVSYVVDESVILFSKVIFGKGDANNEE
ncbi:hypothetical protein [Vibrio cyclitrophicus]|uniref:hypothetical protein n=1 Tax=Vibrio cyclitrophicus TaxID=47951 RepID=UPI00067EE30D|nr:hypothetical protein [Vibrio cyclitrophicus]KNH12768.1 hypothetical protein ACS79_10905 [Vibrio lentus]OBT14151.1 hypothetical protein A9265_03905 [Vibrio cyclitrophicus]PME27947.1 hypothetical protein BCV41_03295 [Vibrio cyclitrophicus]